MEDDPRWLDQAYSKWWLTVAGGNKPRDDGKYSNQLGELLTEMTTTLDAPTTDQALFLGCWQVSAESLDNALDYFLYYARRDAAFSVNSRSGPGREVLIPHQTVEVTLRVNRLVAERIEPRPVRRLG